MNGSMFFLLGFKEMEKCVIKTFAIIRLTLKRSFLMTIMTCFSKKSMNKNPSMRSWGLSNASLPAWSDSLIFSPWMEDLKLWWRWWIALILHLIQPSLWSLTAPPLSSSFLEWILIGTFLNSMIDCTSSSEIKQKIWIPSGLIWLIMGLIKWAEDSILFQKFTIIRINWGNSWLLSFCRWTLRRKCLLSDIWMT